MNNSDKNASMDSRSGNEFGEGRAKVPSEFGFDSSVTATATCSSKYVRTAIAEEISGVLVGEQSVSASDAHA